MNNIFYNISIILSIIIIILIYRDKKKLADKLTKIIIENNLEKKHNLDTEFIEIKNINKKYRVGLRNSKKIYESIK